jgi:hypothetical protein
VVKGVIECSETRPLSLPLRKAFSVPASSVRDLSRQWVELLAHYRRHRNDEHLDALVEEALRYTGLHLENDLSGSSYWSKAPLIHRVAVLLFLVDRGVVRRISSHGRRVYEPLDHAEEWVSSQPSLIPYLTPTLELIAALRYEQMRRARPSRS